MVIDDNLKNKIFKSCLVLIQKHGINGLNIKNLSKMLDADNQKLSNFVKTKRDILDLIQDEIYVNINKKNFLSHTWQEHLVDYSRLLKKFISDTPKLVEILATRPSVTKNALKHTDQSYQVLLNAGFSIEQADFINHSIGIFVIGICMAQYGIEDKDFSAIFPSTEELQAEYPNLYNGLINQDWENYFDNMLIFGINNMISGFALLIPKQKKI